MGAYHFARPDRSKGDAVREAKWFVARTDPRPGELLPVLDIETNNGLTQTQMTTWAHRWIAEVRELTGVTAMVYTSPYGWLERFGDSKRLARDGSPLWVAHWGVSSPLVPAGELGRQGLGHVAVHEPWARRRHPGSRRPGSALQRNRWPASRSAG